MKLEDIIRLLKKQNIGFSILQKQYNSNGSSPVSQTVEKWEKKFIANKDAPHLNEYLWHIFSFRLTKSIEGELATKEYLNQRKSTVLIFNEDRDYLIECVNSIPKIEMDESSHDIYIAHSNMKWTYVITHEIPDIGPFFSTG